MFKIKKKKKNIIKNKILMLRLNLATLQLIKTAYLRLIKYNSSKVWSIEVITYFPLESITINFVIFHLTFQFCVLALSPPENEKITSTFLLKKKKDWRAHSHDSLCSKLYIYFFIKLRIFNHISYLLSATLKSHI